MFTVQSMKQPDDYTNCSLNQNYAVRKGDIITIVTCFSTISADIFVCLLATGRTPGWRSQKPQV